MIGCGRVTEVKLGENITCYYFSRCTLDLSEPFFFFVFFLHPSTTSPWFVCGPGSQYANEFLGGFSHVFRHYIPGGRHVGGAAFSDIVKDLANGMQRLAAHCFGAAPIDWPEPTEDPAEKIAYSMAPLKVERGGVAGTDPRSS